MVKQIIGNVLEELENTAGSTVKQAGQVVKGVVSDAVGQVSGQSKGGNDNSSDWEQIAGKPMDPAKYNKLQQSDEAKKKKNLEAIRKNLIQALESPPEQEQETPKYIKAKVEKQQQEQKELEEQKKKPPPLAQRVAKGMGGAETRGGWGVGG